MSHINNALADIKARGLNKFRCALTGAPYATIDDSEIVIALKAEVEEDASIDSERLIDNWELKALSFNTQVLPSLRGVKTSNLVPMLHSGVSGQAKIFTYMLSRLLFPHIGAEPLTTDKQRNRMLFAIQAYDTAMEMDTLKIADLVQKLVVIDSYCSMPYWHTLWAFESAFSKVGLAKSPAKIQEVFGNPMCLIDNMTLANDLIKYMFELMIHVTERDGVAGKSGNRMAQKIMLIHAENLPRQVIPHFQKTLSEADRINMENRRRMNSRTELRVAHSAIHGKAHLPGANVGELQRMAKELAANRKPKAASEPKEKKISKGIDPRFAAAFKALVLNK